jgi:hypothetical protein
MNLFPSVRLSELRAQRERDRRNFHTSTTQLQNLLREKARPLSLFKAHPGMILGGLASLFALYEVGSSVIPAKKTVGIVSRLGRMGLGMAIKTATPLIASLVQKIWRKAADKKSSMPGDLS